MVSSRCHAKCSRRFKLFLKTLQNMNRFDDSATWAWHAEKLWGISVHTRLFTMFQGIFEEWHLCACFLQSPKEITLDIHHKAAHQIDHVGVPFRLHVATKIRTMQNSGTLGIDAHTDKNCNLSEATTSATFQTLIMVATCERGCPDKNLQASGGLHSWYKNHTSIRMVDPPLDFDEHCAVSFLRCTKSVKVL